MYHLRALLKTDSKFVFGVMCYRRIYFLGKAVQFNFVIHGPIMWDSGKFSTEDFCMKLLCFRTTAIELLHDRNGKKLSCCLKFVGCTLQFVLFSSHKLLHWHTALFLLWFCIFLFQRIQYLCNPYTGEN